jgi:hypothetical protein
MRIIEGLKPVYITLGLVVVIIVCLAPLGRDIVKPMTKDDGWIQAATVAVLCAGVVLVLSRVIVRQQPVLKWIEALYIVCIYAGREMDFHRIFTTEHVTRMKLYTGPFPLQEKVVGAAIMLLFIAVAVHFCVTNISLFVQEFKRKVPRARYIVVWALLLIGSQIIDKPSFFKGYVKPLTEETMELGAAVMLIFIVLSFSSGMQRPSGSKTGQ